jgi:peptide chain release factor 2
VAGPDFDTAIKQLAATMHTIEQVLDLEAMRAEIAQLSEQVSAPDLWDDQANAQRVTGRLSVLQGELDRFAALQSRVDDLTVLVQLGREESDEESMREAEVELGRVQKAVEQLEVRTLLSGEYDVREALITIRSGAGGVDARTSPRSDAMYTRLGGAQQLPRRGLRHLRTPRRPDSSRRPSRSTRRTPTARCRSRPAPTGSCGSALRQPGPSTDVRSPPSRWSRSRADRRDRHPEEEVRVDVYRSSGPGRQSVNTTDSAYGSPTSPPASVVSCQNEKTQAADKASGDGRPQAEAPRPQKAEGTRQLMDVLRGDVQGSWGDQMRNYVLHPYQLVKDLRTEYETGNPQAVFDGDIDAFLEAGIRWRRGADRRG